MPILTDEERIGSLLGKYRIESLLGEGGMGVVYRATNTATGRAVAVKVLRQPLAADTSAHKRFEREARAAAALRHPNVIDVLDLGRSDDGASVMVLELLEGEPLGDLLERAAPLSAAQTLAIVLPVLDALAASHAQGFAHRDLKPDNIFLARGPGDLVTPKLLDFGLAKPLMAEKAAQLTATGNVFGTPSYMSPEQAQGLPGIDHSFDLWAMGVILFEALTGRAPFEAPTAAMLMNKLLSERAPKVRDVLPEVPSPIARVVDRALDPRMAKRPADAPTFKRELEQAAAQAGVPIPRLGAGVLSSLPPPDEGPGPSVPTVTEPVAHATPPPPRRALLVAAGVALGSLLVGGGFLALRASTSADTSAASAPRPEPPPGAERTAPTSQGAAPEQDIPTTPAPAAAASHAAQASPTTETETETEAAASSEAPVEATGATQAHAPTDAVEADAPAASAMALQRNRPRPPRRRDRHRPPRTLADSPDLATMSALPALRGWMQ